jgi:tetratricopeptide (TPR) repeat protein
VQGSDDDVRAWLANVAADPIDPIDRHQALDDVERALFSTPGTPLFVGRYRVLGRLGGGGQGIVHAALDPALDRKVAIKLLRASDDAEARARLLREANALAQLAHPNVVAVLDVGACTAGVYVVTELVDGVTLRQWSKTPRSWREVIATMVAAGRGLAAAHASGIVHRDFKPSNVLIGKDGGVRLLDFGLARTSQDDPSTPGTPISSGPLSDGTLTGPGLAIGTPLYMAPEQHVGNAATFAADQYAFCVALHEALWRQRPFDGVDLEEIVLAKRAGTLPPPPARDPVPRAIHRVVARGLAPHPSQRWPSMLALLAALERAAGTGKRRWWIATLAAPIAIVGVAASVVSDAPRGCADAMPWAGAWDDDRRERVHASFVATGLPFASDAAASVTARVGEYGAAWERARADACAVVDTDPDADRRIACLDRLRADADALALVLEHADSIVVARSGAAVAGLGDPRQCDALGPAPPDRAIASRVAELRSEVARARVLERSGRFEQALASIEPVDDAAQALAYPPLVAEAALVHADIARARARMDEAAQLFERAHTVATASDYDTVAFDAALGLAFVHGNDRRDPEAARPWVRRAEALLARMGAHADPLLEARLALTQASVAFSAGDYPAALERAQIGVALVEAESVRERAAGADDARTAVAWSTLAQAHVRLGQLDEGEKAARHALAIAERTSGPDHPDVAWALQVLAIVEKHRGEFARALALQDRVLTIRENAFGPDDPTLAGTLMSIGVLQSELALPHDAESSYRRALAIQRARLGDSHSDIAKTLHNLAITLRDLKRWDEAIATWHECIAMADRVLGHEHPDLAAYLNGLGSMLADTERADEALPLTERALAIRRKTLGEDHPATAESWLRLGHAKQRAHDLVGARADIERGIGIYERVLGVDHVETARARHTLATQLAAEGRHEEALVQHHRALAALEHGLGADHPTLAEMLADIAAREEALGHEREAAEARARAAAIRTKHAQRK